MAVLTRRRFAQAVVGLPLLSRIQGPEPLPLARGVFPTGELQARIRLTAERVAQAPPTPDDIEAWGAYLSALAVLPPGGTDAAAAVRTTLAAQQTDGRFGPPGLNLGSTEDAPARASLLRACGRVLVGLLEHWESGGDPAVLAASLRLGRFLASAREAASRPAALEPLRAWDGAACLTQLAEGFVMLAEAAEEPRFFEAARALQPLVGPPRGASAAPHLATLRAWVRLAKATDDRGLLREAAAGFRALATSPGLSPAGGLVSPSGAAHDDPAGVAEFLRLTLALWPATGDVTVLEQAERCLVNRFRFGQGATGDFEPRRIEPFGFPGPDRPAGPVSAATLQSYRAFRDILDGLVRREGDTLYLDLFDDAEVTLPGLTLSIRCFGEQPGEKHVSVEVMDSKADWQGLALRRPPWAKRLDLRFDGARVSPLPGPYARIVRRWRGGEQLELTLEMQTRLETRDGRSSAAADLRDPTEALLFVGPRLMAAHEGAGASFLSSAAPHSPTLLLPAVLAAGATVPSPLVPADEGVGLGCREGSAGPPTFKLTLLPLAAATGLPAGRAAMWLRYQAAD